jgi:predicted Zn finger-like uncharacterized protein
MIIVCPQCTARFAVKAEAIGAKGRKVKCAKCANAWFQEPDAEALALLAANTPPAADIAAAPAQAAPEPAKEPEPEVAAPLAEGANFPAVQKQKMKLADIAYYAAAVVAFIFVLSLVSANSVLPNLSGYYSLFGIYDSNDVALSDVAIQKVEDGQFQDLVVSGKIVNQSDKAKKMPNVRVIIYGTANEKLRSITLDSEGAKVDPGQGIDFQNRLVRIPKTSAKVVMDLGNSLDLASR